jgi:hypothetical protein
MSATLNKAAQIIGRSMNDKAVSMVKRRVLKAGVSNIFGK